MAADIVCQNDLAPGQVYRYAYRLGAQYVGFLI